VMDGVFVPNISFGFPVMNVLKREAKKDLDVHLMIVDPDRYINRFKETGASILTVHYEACTHLNRTLNEIKAQGMKAGVALNPHTPVACLDDIIEEADMVLIMSVNPGFGAQKFINTTYKKLEQLKKTIISRGLLTLVQVDGGVNLENARSLMDAGADSLVAGYAIFSSENPAEAIRKFKEL
jgi:ribulose-phosphate 3-epimerase